VRDAAGPPLSLIAPVQIGLVSTKVENRMKKIALRTQDARRNGLSHGSETHPNNGWTHAHQSSVGESKASSTVAASIAFNDNADYDGFVEHEGLRFAGMHLILDLWQASNLDNLEIVERTLRQATEAAGATLLSIDLHSFTPTGGITGVAILAESHISIHTWPEHAYAALDIFMCGKANPHQAIDVLRRAFTPGKLVLAEHKRGLMP
jgi:S-adenosylmethionine decarboxylase